MKRAFTIGPAWLLLGLLMTSCLVDSTNPAAGPSNMVPIPEGWLGLWKVDKIADQIPERPVSLEIVATSDGAANLVLNTGEPSEPKKALLANVNGYLVASIQAKNGSWMILKLVFDADQRRLTALALDPKVLKADIQQGIITGEIDSFDANDDVISVTASGDAIRQYLTEHGNAFGPALASLTKVP
jgi:hypothetical protein